MRTFSVILSEHHQAVIDGLIKSGRYQNASEVLRDGMRLIESRERLETAKLDVLRQAADRGFADLEEGRFQDVPTDALDEFIAAPRPQPPVAALADTRLTQRDLNSVVEF
jgi:antitoxin ParD1/3/4